LILRWVLTIVYLVVLAAAILVQFVAPAISGLLFYGVLGWFVVSLFLYRLPAMNRPIGGPKPTKATADAAPLPSGGPVVSLDFCTHCGTHVAPGTSVCPSCGRTILPV
jgi:hypothetical protein